MKMEKLTCKFCEDKNIDPKQMRIEKKGNYVYCYYCGERVAYGNIRKKSCVGSTNFFKYIYKKYPQMKIWGK
jgi:hypothetical protein